MLTLLMEASLSLANPWAAAASPDLGSRIPQEEGNRAYGGSSDDMGTYVQQRKDGSYIITEVLEP